MTTTDVFKLLLGLIVIACVCLVFLGSMWWMLRSVIKCLADPIYAGFLYFKSFNPILKFAVPDTGEKRLFMDFVSVLTLVCFWEAIKNAMLLDLYNPDIMALKMPWGFCLVSVIGVAIIYITGRSAYNEKEKVYCLDKLAELKFHKHLFFN